MNEEPCRGRALRTVMQRIDRALHRDFCPWANPYVYWLKRPIGWFLVAAIASLLIGVAVAPQGLVMFGAITTVILLGVCWPCLCLHAVSASMSFARPRCREQDVVQITLAVHNRWPLPLWGLSVEGGFLSDSPAVGGTRPTVSLARVPGWSRTSFVFEFTPPRRGVYPVEPPRLATGFPFGIWQSHRPVGVVGELLVWPRTTRLESIPLAGGHLSVVAGIFRDQPGNEGDVIGVRPYRHGDPLRRIHWPQTARRDAMVVCERQDTARRVVQVTIDELFGQDGEAEETIRESAIRIGASICQEFHAHRFDVSCCIGDHRFDGEPGPAGLRRLLDGLARYAPRSACQGGCGLVKSPGPDILSLVVTGAERFADWRQAASRGAGSHRFVLVSAGVRHRRIASPHAEHEAAERGSVWMNLDCHGDVARQFRRQWERICHDSKSGD
jgi:uncharacterized protein (DUF58 family)